MCVIKQITICAESLQWRHDDHDGVWNHQPHGCLLNRLFTRKSKKTSKLRVTGLWVGNSLGPVNSPHKGPVTRKMFPFDDVIMIPGHASKASTGLSGTLGLREVLTNRPWPWEHVLVFHTDRNLKIVAHCDWYLWGTRILIKNESSENFCLNTTKHIYTPGHLTAVCTRCG